jgi:hypothetical protein
MIAHSGGSESRVATVVNRDIWREKPVTVRQKRTTSHSARRAGNREIYL